ncbi:hypothetical protein PoB_000353100 [Plakobranchus ocellatus]|uniref:Uncharacterized protein n=1 Tax=Plakobranchus ocellatus TaxID=259542 RepID=A0AAV3Y1R4_9GAST|nr:hypothetical protein PoB_000353100 [Plakobranchus ocellatus]
MPARGGFTKYLPGGRRPEDADPNDRNCFTMNGGVHHAPGARAGGRGPPIGHKDSNATNITTTSSMDDPETPTDTAQVRGGDRDDNTEELKEDTSTMRKNTLTMMIKKKKVEKEEEEMEEEEEEKEEEQNEEDEEEDQMEEEKEEEEEAEEKKTREEEQSTQKKIVQHPTKQEGSSKKLVPEMKPEEVDREQFLAFKIWRPRFPNSTTDGMNN